MVSAMRLRRSFAILAVHSLQRLETHLTELDRRWIWGHAVRTLLVLALVLCCFGCLGKFFRFVFRGTECSLEKKTMLASPAKDKRPNNQQTPLFLIIFSFNDQTVKQLNVVTRPKKGSGV